MAKIMYQRENNLLLEPREAFYRPFDLGQWTDLRIGMLFRFVGTSSDSASATYEILGVNSETDRFYFGIKDSGSDMPGVSGTKFIGMGTVSGSRIGSNNSGAGGDTFFESGSSIYQRIYFSAYSGSDFVRPLIDQNTNTSVPFSSSASGSSYSTFYGLRITLQNSGAADQRVQLTHKYSFSGLVGTSSADLNSYLVSPAGWASPYSSGPVATASWANGMPLPNSFFIYSPFYNSRLRMSAMQVLKVS